jgi:DNA-directed RNA polymerase specialized sigma24 family protein
VITAAREAWKGAARELPLSILGSDGGEHGEDVELAGYAPDPLAVALARDDARRRLARLTDREREFLVLRALGLSYSETAQATGGSIRTVERQLLRARGKLRPVGEPPGG